MLRALKYTIFFVATAAFPLAICCQTFQLQHQPCNDCGNNAAGSQGSHPASYNYPNTYNYDEEDISSDFGARRTGGYDWHKGVDYSTVSHGGGGDGDVGDHILALVGGDVSFLQGEQGFKYIFIEGDNANGNNFGYGHMFLSTLPGSNGQQIGDMVLIRTKVPVPVSVDPDCTNPLNPNCTLTTTNNYAILHYTSTGVTAWGEVANEIVEYTPPGGSAERYEVVNTVTLGQEIAPIGTSADFGGSVPAHLHLFHLFDPTMEFSNNLAFTNNNTDPLQYVDPYPNQGYSLVITPPTATSITLPITSSNNAPASQPPTLTYPGDQASSIQVRCIMHNAETGTNYQNAIMAIDVVELRIKSSFENDNQYKQISGHRFNSIISHGGHKFGPTSFIAEQRYPREGASPNSTTRDLKQDGIPGSNTETGIDPYSYTSNAIGYPWDDFYFSDFYTRIHKDDDNTQQSTIQITNVTDNARYPDGEYDLKARASTVRDVALTYSVNSQEVSIVIDNFRPYIKKVEVFTGTAATPFYEAEWTVSTGNQIACTPQHGDGSATPGTAIQGNPLTVRVTTSEPMSSFFIANIDPLTASQINPSSQSNSKMEYEFTLSPATTITGNGLQTIHFDGYDLSSNRLEAFSSSPNVVPVRQNNAGTNWTPAPSEGEDVFHQFLFDCGSGKTSGSCFIVEFEADKTTVGAGCLVQFTDLSGPSPTDWLWYITGPDNFISYSQDPFFTFTTPGTYDVKLTASDASGNSDEEEKAGYITVVSNLDADFTADVNTILANQSVNFTDLSTSCSITSRSWNFDVDGFGGVSPSTSTQENPTVIYSTPGFYTVEITVSDGSTSDTETKVNYINVLEESADITLTCNVSSFTIDVGDPVTFSGQAIGGTPPYEVIINFGDPSIPLQTFTSSDGSFEVTQFYSNCGSKNLSVIVIDNNGSGQSKSCSDFVTVSCGVPIPEFTVSNAQPCLGQQVSFLDQSKGGVTNWTWTITPLSGASFVNGTSLSSQNPVVEFASPGLYSVQLQVTGPDGTHAKFESDFINVQDCAGAECLAIDLLVAPNCVDWGDEVTYVFNTYQPMGCDDIPNPDRYMFRKFYDDKNGNTHLLESSVAIYPSLGTAKSFPTSYTHTPAGTFTQFNYGTEITLTISVWDSNLEPNGETIDPAFKDQHKYYDAVSVVVYTVDKGQDKNICNKTYLFDKVIDNKRVITAGGTGCNVNVNSGREITYEAGEAVILKLGFKAHNGSKFVATIDDPCEQYKNLSSEEEGKDTANNYLDTLSYSLLELNDKLINSEGLEDKIKDSIVDVISNSILNAYPNPTTGLLIIELNLKEKTSGKLSICDILNNEVAVVNQGKFFTNNIYEYDFTRNADGVYFVRLITSEGVLNRKVLLAK